MKYIQLNKGLKTMVDDEDFEALSRYKWFAQWNGTDYRAKRMSRHNGRRIQIQMYNQIMKPAKGFEVDHINRDTLDNRKSNLRIVTRSQNQKNKGIQKNNKTGMTGVYWVEKTKRWLVRMKIEGKNTYFGSFVDKQDAIERAIDIRRQAIDRK